MNIDVLSVVHRLCWMKGAFIIRRQVAVLSISVEAAEFRLGVIGACHISGRTYYSHNARGFLDYKKDTARFHPFRLAPVE